MKTAEALPKSTVIREQLIKMEKPEAGPFKGVCMYSKTGFEYPVYTVVGHANFDMVVYEGTSKEKANDIYYKMTSAYDHVDVISDDEL